MHPLLRYPIFFPLVLILLDASDPSLRCEMAEAPRHWSFSLVLVAGAAIALALPAYALFIRPARPDPEQQPARPGGG